jgi:hypothetical protein
VHKGIRQSGYQGAGYQENRLSGDQKHKIIGAQGYKCIRTEENEKIFEKFTNFLLEFFTDVK